MRNARTATLMFATRSARELPTAKIVKPIIASERPKMRPKVCIQVRVSSINLRDNLLGEH